MEKKFDEIIYKIAELLDSKNGENIVLIDVSKVTILADTFVICSGRAVNHVKMLADELEQAMAKEGLRRNRIEGYQEGRWIVLDFGDIIVHLFHKEEREFYDIERLWEDEGNFENFTSTPKTVLDI